MWRIFNEIIANICDSVQSDICNANNFNYRFQSAANKYEGQCGMENNKELV
jgi:hypothetical protein